MPKVQKDSKYKDFVTVVRIILETAYHDKLKKLYKSSTDFIKSVKERDNTIYESIYISGKGYFQIPSFCIILAQDMKSGLFKPVGKWPFTLTQTENPSLYSSLIKTDEEIKFLKQFYSVLSNKYDEGHICAGFLPNILVQHFKFLTDEMPNESVLEECDKNNYKKWKELLELNAVTSLLLGDKE